MPDLLLVRATDPAEAFQLRFASAAASRLRSISGVRVESSGAGLTLIATTERDLRAATSVLRSAFPTARVSATEMAPTSARAGLEPWYRVTVRTPEDFFGDVAMSLNSRGGEIHAMSDEPDGSKLITAEAPVASMIGYDDALAVLTIDRASAEYAFAGYRSARNPPPAPARA